MAKEVPFSQARQQLSTIVDEVQKPGKAVTIMKHGKPAAVIIGHDEYQARFHPAGKIKKWKLAGSGSIPKGVDIDEELRKSGDARTKAWRANMKKVAKDLRLPD